MKPLNKQFAPNKTMTINWKQTFMVACNIAVGIYLFLAVTAFNDPDEAMAKECTEVEIDIEKESMDNKRTTWLN